MTTYFDSSALVAIYVTEPFSTVARREARVVGQIPYTPLHAVEVPNALRALQGRHLITARQLRDLIEQLDSDLNAQRLVQTRADLFAIFDRAAELSKAHTTQLLCRSLDILHVAAAIDTGCDRLLSGDDRQLELARAVGLEAVDVKQTRPRRR